MVRDYCPLLNIQLKDHTLSAVRDCLLDIFAATLHLEANEG
jgi:hypothetical protein